MLLDPKEKREEKERNVHILSQRIPFGIHMHAKKIRSDVSDTSVKQPWRSHP
jgi:hypothetical protein